MQLVDVHELQAGLLPQRPNRQAADPSEAVDADTGRRVAVDRPAAV